MKSVDSHPVAAPKVFTPNDEKHGLTSKDDKPPQVCCGVRKCHSLKDAAIFLNWQDCKFFVGTEKDDQIEHQLFDKIADGGNYVTFQH
jgi:hypothetical protein